jgi:hypothetical protein
MRNLRVGGFFVAVLSLLLTLEASAQATRPTVGQVPKRVAVNPPRLAVIQTTAPELVVVDLGGNGIDLSGAVRTSLPTGSAARMRWTKMNSDDAFLVIDATTLRTSGWSLTTAAGEPLAGSIFPRGGLKVTDASGSSFTPSNAFELLARLDGNRDGQINTSDPAWLSVTLFRDRDADGIISAGELTRANEVLQSLNVTASGTESADAFGTRSVPAIANLRDGATIAITHVKPAAIE